MYKICCTSWKGFAGDIAVKSKDVNKLYQVPYNEKVVISHTFGLPHGMPSGSILLTTNSCFFIKIRKTRSIHNESDNTIFLILVVTILNTTKIDYFKALPVVNKSHQMLIS